MSKNPRESSIQRFVGMSEQGEKEMLGIAKELFENQAKPPFEREKTERESAIINDLIPKLSDFLQEYGIQPLTITPEHVHIADKATLTPEQISTIGISEDTGGYYMPRSQVAVVFASENDLEFMGKVAHELIHANSFSSFTRKGDGYIERRVGLTTTDIEGRTEYFHALNEGLTEELAKRFDKKYSEGIASVAEAFAKRKSLIDSIKSKRPNANTDEILSVTSKQVPDGRWETDIGEYKYPMERRELLKLTNELYEKNGDRFNSREDVFRLFVQAAFSGRIIEIGKLIDHTFGKGSFRTLGEKTERKWKIKE